MQVSVETTEGLQRKLTVQLPSDQIEKSVSKKLSELSKTARINGFRPGKIPLNVVRKRYGAQVQQEVMGEVIESSFRDAVVQEKLRLAGSPNIMPSASEDDSVFQYEATFEVYPEFEVTGVEEIAVERLSAEVGDSDIDEMLESLRKQRNDWSEIERAAADGDQVVIDFTGFVDGEEFQGGKAESAPLVLGSNSMIPGFEDQIAGMSAGEEKRIQVTFPEQYHAENLAGKAAEFDIKVHAVKESVLPEINEEFIQSLGVADGNLDTLRNDIRGNMQRELKGALENQNKSQVMDGLLAGNDVDVPNALVQEEVQRMRQQLMQQMQGQGDVTSLKDELFQDEASRRVKLGLVVAELVKQAEINIKPEQVREMVEEMASAYQEPKEVIDYYYQNKEMLQNIEGLVLEREVVSWVMERCKVTDVEKSFREVMEAGRKQDAPQEETA